MKPRSTQEIEDDLWLEDQRRKRIVSRIEETIARREFLRTDAPIAIFESWVATRALEPPSADPLNILPENARRAARRASEMAKSAKRTGKKTQPRTEGENLRDAETTVDDFYNIVSVKARGERGFLKGLFAHQIEAAERFSADWKLAEIGPLKSPSLVAKVDSSGRNGALEDAVIEAGKRLRDIHKEIGERDWAIVVAFVIHGISARGLSSMGGGDTKVAHDSGKLALDKVASYYNLKGSYRDKVWEAALRVNEGAFKHRP